MEWDRKRLRRHVGVVQQEIYLFEGTLRDNLCLGRQEFSDAYLEEKCIRAQLWPFLEDRGGLDMHIYEGGSNLSIGQKQLLSFARILVFDPPVLVLDEATSSVDRILEKRMMEAVREIVKGRTTIVIAHRLSTIRDCHSLLVVEEGKIAEAGTYSELLKAEGPFARFHEIHAGM